MDELNQFPQIPHEGEPTHANRQGCKEHLKQKFLESFRLHGTILEASRAVGVHRDTIANWRRTDAAFAREFELANVDITERLEGTAFDRAVNGVERPVFFRDREIARVREYSDAILTFLLKARSPDKYRENRGVNSGEMEKFVNDVSADVISVLRRVLPDQCPECRHGLQLKNKVAGELDALAIRLKNGI